MNDNPLVRQRMFAQGEVRAETPFSVIRVSGGDRLSWLNSLFSQKLDELSMGDSVETLSLDAQGRIQQIIRVIVTENSLLLITHESVADQLHDYLLKMRFRKMVEVEKADYSVVASYGNPVSDLFWKDSWPEVRIGGYRYGTRNISHPLFLNLFEHPQSDLIDYQSIEPLRIFAGRAAETEIDEKTMPHELDLLTSAVHLQKGCYRGQEAVAKVHKLGHPPRRLTMLYLEDGTDLPEVGDELFIGDRSVGKVTVAGNHFEAGPIALALLKRSVDPLAELRFENGLAATQEVLVPQSAGSVSDVPKMPRLRLSNRP
jgi:folate-binding protein YgfZ